MSHIIAIIRRRGELYQKIRVYFREQGVSEVEVPLLGRSSVPDVHLASMEVLSGDERLYLQTSPELFMKRLLAAGSGSIFSIGKAFREAESGARHNPEFSMLEWYRVGFDLEDLIRDVHNLCAQLLPSFTAETRTYASLFEQHLQLNPHRCSAGDLDEAVWAHTGYSGRLNRAESLDLLMSSVIEPRLGSDTLFVTDYPVCQTSMAETALSDGDRVARRFELYVRGIEIANGYQELRDTDQQRHRFEQGNRDRAHKGLPEVPVDEPFLQALAGGLPVCSGVAVGLDRLLWLAGNPGDSAIMNLCECLLFPWDRL